LLLVGRQLLLPFPEIQGCIAICEIVGSLLLQLQPSNRASRYVSSGCGESILCKVSRVHPWPLGSCIVGAPCLSACHFFPAVSGSRTLSIRLSVQDDNDDNATTTTTWVGYHRSDFTGSHNLQLRREENGRNQGRCFLLGICDWTFSLLS
jgi:hypothetical protein